MHTLVSARLRLEPLVVAHADALYPILADPRQHEFLDDPGPASLEALRERYRKLESRRSGDGREWWLNWALVPLVRGSSAIGFVQATVQADKRAWVAYEVGHAWWGQGYGTEATRAMVEHLVTYPLTMLTDRFHPARGAPELPLMSRSGRAFAESTFRHLLFGVVLGALVSI